MTKYFFWVLTNTVGLMANLWMLASLASQIPILAPASPLLGLGFGHLSLRVYQDPEKSIFFELQIFCCPLCCKEELYLIWKSKFRSNWFLYSKEHSSNFTVFYSYLKLPYLNGMVLVRVLIFFSTTAAKDYCLG